MRSSAIVSALFSQALLAVSFTLADDQTPDINATTPSTTRRADKAAEIEALRGTWICVESAKDGEPVDRYVGVRAVFDGNNMTWIYPAANGQDRRQACRVDIDVTKNPKHFDWYPLEKPESRALRLYKIEDGMLYMATNLSSTVRPKSFADAAWTFRCRKLQTRQASSSVEDSKSAVSWGKIIDPDGDCTFRQENEKLTISVPSGEHEIWYGNKKPEKRFNAPRVLREVKGDFAARVKVSANWQLASGGYARAAGLVVWDSEKQYLRHERCQFIHSSTGKHACFTTPLYDRNEQRVNDAKAGAASFYQGDTTWLHMERKGQIIHTWVSHNGKDWQHTGTITSQFPRSIQIGVDALNRSNSEFVAVFEDLSISQK